MVRGPPAGRSWQTQRRISAGGRAIEGCVARRRGTTVFDALSRTSGSARCDTPHPAIRAERGTVFYRIGPRDGAAGIRERPHSATALHGCRNGRRGSGPLFGRGSRGVGGYGAGLHTLSVVIGG